MEASVWQQTLNSCENIDSLRTEFESNKEWRLRKKFLDMNYGSLQMDRLVCLSRCFVNIAMYGCSYPVAVMKEVQERSRGILEEVNAEKKVEKKVEAKQKYAASFVKASSGPATLSSVDSLSANTADLKKVLPSAQAADTSALLGRFSGNPGSSKVIHSELVTNPKTVVSVSSTVSDDYGYWGGQDDATGNIPFEESIEQSTVRVINTNPGLQSQRTPFTNSGPYSEQPKTTLSKEECLAAYQKETNPVLQKMRKLAFEILQLKSAGQNSKEVLNSAGNRVPVMMDFAVEQVVNKRSVNFLCRVLIEGVEVASEIGPNIKQAKTNACESALKVIMMPRIEIIQSGGTHPVLKGTSLTQERNLCQIPPAQNDTSMSSSARRSSYDRKFSSKATPYYKESNSQLVKRKRHDFKALEDFIIVEQWVPSSAGGAVNILKQSADFNRMLLEYDFFTQGMATRCVVKIEGEVVADVMDSTKPTAKTTASAQCLSFLRTFCWVLKTKQAVDSTTSISKEEIQKEIQLKSNQISSDNIGSKMLKKMGWSGGGVGKDGTGISEPVSMESVINRQGLGLSAACGISGDFRQRMKEVIENYATSGSQEDLAFSSEFNIEERKIIHDECRKLNLRSVSRGKGQNRYLCVSRKRSANQLFEHVMACGGETAKYKLLPPGTDVADEDQLVNYDEDVAE